MLYIRNAVKIICTIPPRSSKLYSTQDKAIPDYYGILGVPRDATPAEIKGSFLELSKIHHPDVNLDNKDRATKKFMQIKEAYTNLSDQAARDIYNSRLDNIFSANFDDTFPKSYHTHTPPPMHVPEFIKWLDKTFPTYSFKVSARERNKKHFQVILAVLAVCLGWHAIQTWRIKSRNYNIKVNLDRKSAENERYLEEVRRRAHKRNHWEHLADLKRISSERAKRRRAESNREN